MLRVSPFIFTVLLFASTAKGQSVQEIQDKILYYTQSINKWDTSADKNSYDSLKFANKKLLNYLNAACKNDPATIKTDFKLLESSRMNILTSDDKKFRIYFWDVGNCGGACSNDVLIQYQIGDKTKTLVASDVSQMPEGVVSSGLYYSGLYSINTKNDETIYLALGAQKVAMGLYIYNLQSFKIDGKKLNNSVKFFKTKKGSVNNIGYEVESTLLGSNDPDIKISPDKSRIYIPIVTGDGAVTNKHLVYVFDGNNYVFDKNAK